MFLPNDRRSVQQETGRHEHAVEEHGMRRGHPQVSVWQAISQRPGAEQNGLHARVGGKEPPGVGTAADPADGLGNPGNRDDAVAELQVFDGL